MSQWIDVQAGAADTSSWATELENIIPGGSAAATSAVNWQDLAANIGQLLTTYATTDAQRRLLNIQLDRAQKGLPPLDSSNYGLGVNVGISPTLQNGMLLLGLGALVLFALKKR